MTADSLEAPVLDLQGKEVGRLALPKPLFGQKPSPRLLHEVVTAYLANQRRGTAHAKTRSEVSGGGRKPWKQKHTGRARHGSIRSPLWRKGGVVFGPRPRSYRQELPSGKRGLALTHALSAKQLEGGVAIVKALDFSEPKTKNVVQFLKKAGAARKTLLVFGGGAAPEGFCRAARNIRGLEWLRAEDLNAYEVLRAGKIFLTEPAVRKLEAD